jgi:hypothetical protein
MKKSSESNLQDLNKKASQILTQEGPRLRNMVNSRSNSWKPVAKSELCMSIQAYETNNVKSKFKDYFPYRRNAQKIGGNIKHFKSLSYQ